MIFSRRAAEEECLWRSFAEESPAEECLMKILLHKSCRRRRDAFVLWRRRGLFFAQEIKRWRIEVLTFFGKNSSSQRHRERERERREKKPNEEEAEEESSSMELWRIQLQKIPHLLEARIFCLLAMIPVGCCGRRSRPYWNTIKSKARVRGDHRCSCSKKECTSRSRSIPRTIHRPCSTSFSWVKEEEEEEEFRLFVFGSLWLFQEEESSKVISIL